LSSYVKYVHFVTHFPVPTHLNFNSLRPSSAMTSRLRRSNCLLLLPFFFSHLFFFPPVISPTYHTSTFWGCFFGVPLPDPPVSPFPSLLPFLHTSPLFPPSIPSCPIPTRPSLSLRLFQSDNAIVPAESCLLTDVDPPFSLVVTPIILSIQPFSMSSASLNDVCNPPPIPVPDLLRPVPLLSVTLF